MISMLINFLKNGFFLDKYKCNSGMNLGNKW